jgi:hypothetical protein
LLLVVVAVVEQTPQTIQVVVVVQVGIALRFLVRQLVAVVLQKLV